MPLAVIFGGSGFIGTHLRAELEHREYEVIIADLVPPQRDPRSYQYCDVRNPIELNLGDIPDVVFNLAAIHRTPGHAPPEYYDTNVWGALNITDWCSHIEARKLIFTSSISVYGRTEAPKDEVAPLCPDSPYGKSKALAEAIHSHWLTKNSERQLIIVRPAVIFGPGEQGNFTRLAQALRSGRFYYPGRSDTIKACGSVWDLVDSLLYVVALDAEVIIYNFCYPERYTIADICQAFRAVAPSFPEPRALPIGPIARLSRRLPGPIGVLGERIMKVSHSTNIVPGTLLSMNYQYSGDLIAALQRWYVTPPSGCFV